MAEILGVATGVFSLVDLTVRVVKYICEVKNGLGSVGRELESLEKQVVVLNETSKTIRKYSLS